MCILCLRFTPIIFIDQVFDEGDSTNDQNEQETGIIRYLLLWLDCDWIVSPGRDEADSDGHRDDESCKSHGTQETQEDETLITLFSEVGARKKKSDDSITTDTFLKDDGNEDDEGHSNNGDDSDANDSSSNGVGDHGDKACHSSGDARNDDDDNDGSSDDD